MIEELLVQLLTSALVNVNVACEEPANPPEKMVIIRKTGSKRENRIDRATVAIQSYGKSLYEAAKLNQKVKNAMLEGTVYASNRIGHVELNSDYNYTDSKTRRYRYQAVFDLTYYEEETNNG